MPSEMLFHFICEEYVLIKHVLSDILEMQGGDSTPLKPREMEKIILADGWTFKGQVGSHRHYTHPIKPGKVTIPFHKGKEIQPITEKSIRKQAGLL